MEEENEDEKTKKEKEKEDEKEEMRYQLLTFVIVTRFQLYWDCI